MTDVWAPLHPDPMFQRQRAERYHVPPGAPRCAQAPAVSAAWAHHKGYCSSSSLSAPGSANKREKGSGTLRWGDGCSRTRQEQSSDQENGGTNRIQAGARRKLRESKPFLPNPIQSGPIAGRETTPRGLGRVCLAIQLSPWEGGGGRTVEEEEGKEGSPAVGHADAQVPGLRQGPRGRHRARQCAGVGVPAGLRRVVHPDADGVQRRRAFPRAVDRLQARRRARPPQDYALQGVRGQLVGASRLGEGSQHQGVLRRHIPVAAAAAERDHRAGREETEEALPEEIQEQGRGALGGGHGERARVRHLPRGQPQGRAARLRPHALHAVLRGLEREVEVLPVLPRLP